MEPNGSEKKITLLIVDDSRIFRSALEKSLEGVDDISIIGSVFSGEKAMEFIGRQRPDLVTLDIEMFGMDGLETLEAIREFNESTPELQPVGVIMISIFTGAGTELTIRALEAGAFDFVTKPRAENAEEGVRIIRRQLVKKIRQYMSNSEGTTPSMPSAAPDAANRISRRTSQKPLTCQPPEIKAILIGASTGGPKALNSFLPDLCRKTDVPILIAQHMPPLFTRSLAKILDKKCRFGVKEGENGETVCRKSVYIAPGGKHMLLRTVEGRATLVTNSGPPEEGCRPSANILFRSAAAAYSGNVVALVLTGMGADGAKGVVSLKRAGAFIIAQDEASSIVWGMPKSAVNTGCVDEIVPLSRIPDVVEFYMCGK